MPVIVVGADTPLGFRIVEALADTDQEVRAFVTDPEMRPRLKALGIKVATGDVSDASHVEGACTNAFTVVLVTEAADDDRERSFAPDRTAVLAGWAEAVGSAGVSRVIWIDGGEPPTTQVTEEVVVDTAVPVDELLRRVVSLDEAESIPSRR
ncbi:MAG: NAD(P)H-binding protein [Acidimicrobiia bacterium]